MSSNSSEGLGNRTTYTLGTKVTLKDYDKDSISYRIEFIKSLLEGKKLNPLINFDSCDTEGYINPHHDSSDNEQKKKDAQYVLDKQMHNFYQIISTIGGKLSYIKSGTTGHTFKGTIVLPDSEILNYGCKVVAYPKREKYGECNDLVRPENAELLMIRLLSYFVYKKQTPHIVLPIATFNTNIKPFVKLIEQQIVDQGNKKYLEFIEKYKSGEYYETVSILLSEWANRGDFLEFVKKYFRKFTLIHWRVFFFQLISTIAVIQSKYPTFRHNDLKANNVLVHKIDTKPAKFSYTIVKQKYSVPNIGYQLKIWDFDFACIPKIVDNQKVEEKWTKYINVMPIQNKYYDIHYFFNTLIHKGFFPQFLTEDCVPLEVKEFVLRVVPDKFRRGPKVHKRGRILVNDEYLTPDEILKNDPFFSQFKLN